MARGSRANNMRRWYVIHTQPKGEIRAKANLERQDYEVYLPRCRKWRRHARRAEIVAVPLFPRYLFIRLDIESQRWRPVLSTFGVADFVCRSGAPTPVPEGVIEGIKSSEDADRFVDLAHQAAFRPGDKVQVMAGPFADQVAKFDGLNDQQRVILLLELLGRELRVTVPAESIAACA
jgi:transcriptional antiterminator RfaH